MKGAALENGCLEGREGCGDACEVCFQCRSECSERGKVPCVCVEVGRAKRRGLVLVLWAGVCVVRASTASVRAERWESSQARGSHVMGCDVSAGEWVMTAGRL